MESVLTTLLIFVLFSSAVTQFDGIKPCVICDDRWFIVPTSWENMSRYLRGGCNRLEKDIIWPCRDLVDSTNLYDQYPKLYPYIVQLHKQACNAFCRRG